MGLVYFDHGEEELSHAQTRQCVTIAVAMCDFVSSTIEAIVSLSIECLTSRMNLGLPVAGKP